MICWQSSLHYLWIGKIFYSSIIRIITQQELSFVMHEIISKDRYNQANSVTHIYSFSIQHLSSFYQSELRSAFSVKSIRASLGLFRRAVFSQVERCSDCVAYMKNLMKNFDDLNVIKWTQICYVIFINKVYFFENKIVSLWMLLT